MEPLEPLEPLGTPWNLLEPTGTHRPRSRDHAASFLGETVRLEVVRRDERDVNGVRSGFESTVARLTEVIHEHEVILYGAVFVEENAIEDVHHGPDVDVETRFLANLARDARFERLAKLELATRQAPLPGQRLVTTLDEHDTTVVIDHDRADADDWPIGSNNA